MKPSSKRRLENLFHHSEVLVLEGPELDTALVEDEDPPIVVWIRHEEATDLLDETPEKSGDTLIEALTPRELEVLRLVAEGLSNKEVAARLGISEHTAKFHVAAIMGKLSASSRTEAVSAGIRNGWIMI